MGGIKMSKFKEVPRCPYCGGEMRIEKPIFADKFDASLVNAKAGWCTQAACNKCWSVAPFVSGMETEQDAYEAVCEMAMQQYEEPNRVLTLDEVLKIACDDYNTEQETVMYLEYREDYEGYAIVTDLETDGSKILLEFSGIVGCVKPNEKDYGSLWRCWRRKPTKNERKNTPWEDKER